MEFSDQQERTTISLTKHQSRMTRILRGCLSLLIVSILPNDVYSVDFECGVNRFNNESPLTERIVGGNNSLQ